jgi:hypothetical protein
MDQQGEQSRRDEYEWALRMEQMRADIGLKDTQRAAEWPKVFTAALVAVAAIFTAFGALVTALVLHGSQH